MWMPCVCYHIISVTISPPPTLFLRLFFSSCVQVYIHTEKNVLIEVSPKVGHSLSPIPLSMNDRCPPCLLPQGPHSSNVQAFLGLDGSAPSQAQDSQQHGLRTLAEGACFCLAHIYFLWLGLVSRASDAFMPAFYAFNSNTPF